MNRKQILGPIGLLLVMYLAAGCVEEEIELSDSRYYTGGRGTSETKGAVEFDTRNVALGDVVRITLFLHGGQRLVAEGNDLVFSNLEPGSYRYRIEAWFWTGNGGVGVSTGIGFGSGGLYGVTTYNVGGGGWESDTLEGNADVLAGQTLLIQAHL